MLTFDEYQKRTDQFALYPGHGTRSPAAINYVIAGATGEAGELMNTWKKVLRGDFGVCDLARTEAGLPGNEWETARRKLLVEGGGAVWYVARICTELGISFEELA